MKAMKVDPLRFAFAAFVAFFFISLGWQLFSYLLTDTALQITTLSFWMILGRAFRYFMIFYVFAWMYNLFIKKF